MQDFTNFTVSKQMGIYSIINTTNNKRYIGSAINLSERLKQHRCELIKNIHFNIHLQRAFNKDKIESFKIEILESFNKIDYKLLLKLEDYYILKYNSIDRNFGYNKRTNDTFPILSKESQIKRQNKQNSRRIQVMCFYKDSGIFYKKFESITECAHDLKDQTTNVSCALDNLSRSVKGFVIIKSINYNPNKIYKYIPFDKLNSKETIRKKQINNKANIKTYILTANERTEYISISDATRFLCLKKDSLSHLLKKHGCIKYKEYLITLDKNQSYNNYINA